MTWLTILNAILLTGWLTWLSWLILSIRTSLKSIEMCRMQIGALDERMTHQVLKTLIRIQDDLGQTMPPLVEMASRTLTLVEQENSRRVDEDAQVGKTWLMSPREQADVEKQLRADSAVRVQKRHYGSVK